MFEEDLDINVLDSLPGPGNLGVFTQLAVGSPDNIWVLATEYAYEDGKEAEYSLPYRLHRDGPSDGHAVWIGTILPAGVETVDEIDVAEDGTVVILANSVLYMWVEETHSWLCLATTRGADSLAVGSADKIFFTLGGNVWQYFAHLQTRQITSGPDNDFYAIACGADGTLLAATENNNDVFMLAGGKVLDTHVDAEPLYTGDLPEMTVTSASRSIILGDNNTPMLYYGDQVSQKINMTFWTYNDDGHFIPYDGSETTITDLASCSTIPVAAIVVSPKTGIPTVALFTANPPKFHGKVKPKKS